MEVKSRIDSIVEDAGVSLASKQTRRGFLGKMAGLAGALAMGGSAIILGEHNQALADAAPAGCYGTTDGMCCFRGWKVVVAESGYSGVVIRKGPSFSAPPVYNNGVVCIGVNGHVCRQSNRTSAAGGCGDPGSRPTTSGGWMYVYGHANRKQGWVPYNPGGVTYLVPDTAAINCCGPESLDYDCSKAKSACPSYNGCTGQTAGSVTTSGAYWSIRNDGTNELNSNQKFYIRYAANGTSTGWVVPGDKIKRLAYKTGWSCIYAYCCAWLPYGCRGWMDSNALGTSGSYSSCGGAGACASDQYYP